MAFIDTTLEKPKVSIYVLKLLYWKKDHVSNEIPLNIKVEKRCKYLEKGFEKCLLTKLIIHNRKIHWRQSVIVNEKLTSVTPYQQENINKVSVCVSMFTLTISEYGHKYIKFGLNLS